MGASRLGSEVRRSRGRGTGRGGESKSQSLELPMGREHEGGSRPRVWAPVAFCFFVLDVLGSPVPLSSQAVGGGRAGHRFRLYRRVFEGFGARYARCSSRATWSSRESSVRRSFSRGVRSWWSRKGALARREGMRSEDPRLLRTARCPAATMRAAMPWEPIRGRRDRRIAGPGAMGRRRWTRGRARSGWRAQRRKGRSRRMRARRRPVDRGT
jgi:hypothetical protein